MSTILAFDASSTVASCALLADGEAVAELTASPRELLGSLASLLRGSGIGLAELDALVVGLGPGSFTSIRIALATAQGLSAALGLSAAGVSSLLAYRGGRPVIDARRGEVFSDGPWVGSPAELPVSGERLVGDGALRYRAVFEAAGADVPPDNHPDHLPAARLLLEHAVSFGAAELLEPLYVRAPDATPSR